MAEFFPYKSEVDTLALKDALDRDAPKKKGAVNWQGLFMEDREGNQVRNARTKNVGNSQSCMVSKLRIICKQSACLALSLPPPGCWLTMAAAVGSSPTCLRHQLTLRELGST